MADAVAKPMPAVLKGLFALPNVPGQTSPTDDGATAKNTTEAPSSSSRGDRFYSEEQETKLSQDLLDFITKVFSRALTKEKWKELTTCYPQIKDTESLLVAPTMEAGMKEDIKKRHGYTKTKEFFAFDDGLAERHAAFIVVARPILAALSVLDSVGGEDDAEAVDPDEIKDLLMLWFYLAMLTSG